jgi:hypothetical protein
MVLWLTQLYLLFVTTPSGRTVCKVQLLEDGPNLRSQNVCQMHYLCLIKLFSVSDR